MDLRRSIFGFAVLVVFVVCHVSANVVLNVVNKFDGRQQGSLSAMKEHDSRRHRRMLYNIDLPLGGNGLADSTGLYFTQLGIGSPTKTYYVQVDTGSDILWVNCVGCANCPTKSDLGVDLKLYDPNASNTAQIVGCDAEFCAVASGGPIPGCIPNSSYCGYNVVYGDGSSTSGYYVNDVIQFNQVTGNLQTTTTNKSIIFGCGAKQSGDLGSTNGALDGILGFGQSNSSMISQLASSGKVNKIFSHCFGGANGGGIFAIGEVVQPKVKTTSLVQNQPHYNVNMESVEVGGTVLQLPTDVFDTGNQKGTIIDSGTTLAYLADVIYEPMMNAIMAQNPNLTFQSVEGQFSCFQYTDSVDKGFPSVTFNFQNSLALVVYPHDYLFQYQGETWCIGWQNSGNQSREARDLNLLGDLVLSNKLVIYDLENQTIGWTEYNCSSTIKMQNDQTRASFQVGYHDISSAWSPDMGRFVTFLLLTFMLHNLTDFFFVVNRLFEFH
ncbi:aspartic proteinase 36-like isoform X1 [Macadamia integrifolia]|uniref:aspartic proteinase 36-like isoform X1 n=1 Tax=Macadamia integrifolia TaxID=60698 RepID=UPI001C50111D|nr:aspartic proteinase 36-like isoform X1 [Macadamia integrifolia]